MMYSMNDQQRRRMMFNKNWDSHVKACWEIWHNHYVGGLGFLKQLPTYHAYLGMVGMATSVNHLERLHQVLPANCRLLREDWIKLRDFWQDYFTGDSAEKFRDQLSEWLLFEQSTSWENVPLDKVSHLSVKYAEGLVWEQATAQLSTACGYYVNLIKGHGITGPPKHFGDSEDGGPHLILLPRVLSCPERNGNGYNHFQAKLFDQVIKAGLSLSEDRQHMLVRLVFEEAKLTEELTYKLISQLPKYYLWKYGVVMSSAEGEHLNFSFGLEMNKLILFLDPCDKDMVASSNFLPAFAEALREYGIPLEGDLIPILVKSSTE